MATAVFVPISEYLNTTYRPDWNTWMARFGNEIGENCSTAVPRPKLLFGFTGSFPRAVGEFFLSSECR